MTHQMKQAVGQQKSDFRYQIALAPERLASRRIERNHYISQEKPLVGGQLRWPWFVLRKRQNVRGASFVAMLAVQFFDGTVVGKQNTELRIQEIKFFEHSIAKALNPPWIERGASPGATGHDGGHGCYNT